MFRSDDFWDEPPLIFLKILKLLSFYSSNFKIFKNALGQFFPNLPPKHVITSNNSSWILIDNFKLLKIFQLVLC